MSSSDDAQSMYGPAPMQLRPLALVFGRGMARGYVHVGALRALAENKVPVNAIYGMEMGSLIAAVYALDPNINHFEWTMLRFKDELFETNEDNLLQKFFEPEDRAAKLERQLTRVFGKKDIQDAKIPLRIAIQEPGSALPTILAKGPLVPAVRAALAVPGIFSPAAWDGRATQAALSLNSVAYLCEDAKAQGGSPVVLVDGGIGKDDIRSADIVIWPNLNGVGEGDFQRKTEAAFQGKRAVQDKMSEIRRWVGLPPETVSMAVQGLYPAAQSKDGISQ